MSKRKLAPIDEIRAEVASLKRQRETVHGYLRAHPEEETALQHIAEAEGFSSTGAYVVHLVRQRIAQARQATGHQRTRPRILNDGAIRRHFSAIWGLIGSRGVAVSKFVVIDQTIPNVYPTNDWPQQKSGMAVLDLRRDDELRDVTGMVTEASVLAWLNGWARPDPRLEKAMGER